MLSSYRGNSAAPTGATSGKAILVTLTGGGGNTVFAPPVVLTHANTPYTIPDATSTTLPERTYLCDTSGGVLTVNLPATPVDGEIVNIKRTTTDGTTLTIGRNGSNIEGAAANLTDNNAALSSYQLQYSASASGWYLIG